MKSMHIDSVINFPFPTPPDRDALRKAETTLTHIGALEAPKQALTGTVVPDILVGGQVTEVGKVMSLFPLLPRFARMLVSGRQRGCLPYVVVMVSALSVGDPFLHEEHLDQVDEAEEEDDIETMLVQSEELKAKAQRKQLRRAYYKMQEVQFILILMSYLS